MLSANQPEKLNYKIVAHSQMSEFNKGQWNSLLVDNYPFLKYEFLHNLEIYDCVGERFGWLPCHIGVYQQNNLVAAMPLYLKNNSYGEFVFDNGWADAWEQNGLNYFPKLVCSIPFTPVSGPRFLISKTNSENEHRLWQLLVHGAKQIAKTYNASGVHFLFSNAIDKKRLIKQTEFVHRCTCQFHWHNQNYDTFDDFLSYLKPKKRKNITRERKQITNDNVSFRILNGVQATDKDWQDLDFFYRKTFIDKYGLPTFNINFFKAIAKDLPNQVILILADLHNKCIAGALMYRSDSVLYGRHWGCVTQIKNLHFETCYYQGIEYCINNKLNTFEPGAGGEYKMNRGFVPTLTHSSHWLAPNPFQESIKKFCKQEQEHIELYKQNCEFESVYKQV